MKNLTNHLQNFIYICYGILAGLILLDVLLVDKADKSLYIYDVMLPNIVLVIIGGILLYFYSRRIAQPVKWNVTRIMLISAVILFVLQLLILYCLYQPVGEDVWVIRNAAECYVRGQYDWYSDIYFKQNINNVGIYSLTVLFLRLGNLLHVNGYTIMLVLGAILLNMAVLTTGLAIHRICNNDRITLLGYYVAAVLFGLSPWMVAAYTDVYSIALPILSIYIYISLKEREMNVVLKKVCSYLLPVLSYFLKPTNVIIFVAILIMDMLSIIRECEEAQSQRTRLVLRGLLHTGIALALVAAIALAARMGLSAVVAFDPDNRIEKTAAHYALMGANEETNGKYSLEDDLYTGSFIGTNAKNEADLTLLRERLSNMGATGYLRFQSRKMLVDFNNGLFAWGSWTFRDIGEGESIEGAGEDASVGSLATFLRNLYYVNGDYVLQKSKSAGEGGVYFPVLAVIAQFLWVNTLLLGVMAALLGWRHRKAEDCSKSMKGERHQEAETLVILSLLGFTLYLIIFEASARYLFSYAPVFVVAGMIGLQRIVNIRKKL